MNARDLRKSLLLGVDTTSGDAVAGEIKTGKKAWVDGEEITGTKVFYLDDYAGCLANTWDHGYDAEYLPAVVSINAPHVTRLTEAFDGQSSVENLTIVISDNVSTMWRAFYNMESVTEITLGFTTALNAYFEACFLYCTNLVTINGELDFSGSSNNNYAFGSCDSLVNALFTANSISTAISLGDSPSLSNATLLSLANGLDVAEAETLTMHATAKAAMDALMVDNDSGTAVAGTAMTLTAFVQTVKGWTVATA